MSMIHHQPWDRLAQLRHEMNRMRGEGCTASEWMPPIDIREGKEGFTITADLPGVAPNDIDIQAENGMLTIQGERDSSKRDERQGYSRIERAHGSFLRRFTLPESADTDQISARGENGVLTITIPKRAEIQPRRITVEG